MALIGQVHDTIEKRRIRNGECKDWENWRMDIKGMWRDIWVGMKTHVTHTRKAAERMEERIKLLYPKKKNLQKEGPIAEWKKEWCSTGWATGRGKLLLEKNPTKVRGNYVWKTVTPWAWNIHPALRIWLRWMKGKGIAEELKEIGPETGVIAKVMPGCNKVTVLYTDGAYDQARKGGTQMAGYGIVGIECETGEWEGEGGKVLKTAWGAVETRKKSPIWRGAKHHTNNTGELTALGEGLRWLANAERAHEQWGIIRPDSEYAIGVAVGDIRMEENIELGEWVKQMYRKAKEKWNGRLKWAHVKAHANHKWNEKADGLAVRGSQGLVQDSCNTGEGWEDVRLDGGILPHRARHAKQGILNMIVKKTKKKQN